MVQQYRSPVRVYKHPFELVMAAYEKRFPTCKMIPIFLGSDITSEFKSEDGARHVVERRCKLAVDAPYLVKKIIGVEFVYFIQKNALDRRARTLDIEAHNESFSSRVVIRETCKYFVHPENSSWTCFEQTASLDIKSFLGFENAIEKVAIKQYSHNISKGKEVIEYYIAELLASGAASQLTPFSEPPSRKTSRPKSAQLSFADLPPPATATATEPEPEREEREERSISTGNTLTPPSNSADANACNTLDGKLESISKAKAKAKVDGTSETSPSCVGEDQDQSVGEQEQDARVQRSATLTSCTSESSTCTLAADEVELEAVSASQLGLDEDYIQRYLGSLTPLEVSGLLQLRDSMAHDLKTRLPSDATMLRFLRARACNVEKARLMLGNSLRWRRCYAIDRLLATYEACEVLSRYFSGGWHYFDKQFRPVYLLRLGAVDVKGLLRSCGEERVLRHVLAACEEAVRKLNEATKVRGHAVSACTLVLDLDGLGMRHLWRPGVRTLMRILQHMEANYPEMMNRVLVVRAPRIFPILWTLVSPFIDDATREKFVVFSGREHLGPDGLEAFVDRQHLPLDLGGECEWCAVPEGGLVPKAAYRVEHETAHTTLSPQQESESESESEKAHESGLEEYSVASINSTDGFEVRYQVAHAGSVITWDFEVLDGDVEFRLFSLPVRNKAAVSDDSGVASLAFETPQLFANGASVQGSHVATSNGLYVLRWTPNAKSNLARTQSATKLSYYTELVSHDRLHGSLTSLRSCRTSFCS